jgi:ATP-dependent Clp protease ATP-binding subunit ClpA
MARLFDTFSDEAHRAMLLAYDEAWKLRHYHIGTEHIIIGLSLASGSVAARLIADLGLTPGKLRLARLEVERILGAYPGEADRTFLTPMAHMVLQHASDEARLLKHEHIGTEHILLSMTREPESIAAQMLESRGVTLERLQSAVLAFVRPAKTPLETSSSDLRMEEFTEPARKTLQLAQEEAQRLHHSYIGSEHLLLGLIREEHGVAARVLNNLGIELDKARSAVEFILGRGHSSVLSGFVLTPRAEHIIELAKDEARRLHQPDVGTEHLLLGMVRDGGSIAAGLLESLGVRLETVRAEVLRVVSPTPRSEQHKPRIEYGVLGRSEERLSSVRRTLHRIFRRMPPPAVRFDKFTYSARKVLRDARREALQAGHSQMEAEDLLLGVMTLDDNLLVALFRVVGLDQDKIRSMVLSTYPHIRSGLRSGALVEFSPAAALAIEQATYEARQLQHPAVGPEHLFLGLLLIDEDRAAQILSSVGVTADAVRQFLTQALSGPPAETTLNDNPNGG